VLVSLTASSQTVTKNSTDSLIPLPKNVAKEVVKDVLRKDSLETELKIVNLNQEKLKSNLVAKDSLIASKDSIITLWMIKEKNYLLIGDYMKQQKDNVDALNKKLAADLRQAKRKNTTKSIVSTVIISALAYLYISK
jgi:hypothetical protein